MEWTVFCSQVQKEIMTVSKGEVIGSKLMLTKDTDSILYEKYGTSLRRRVNLTGHEILLQNVQEVSFVRLKNGIMLTVTDLEGKVFSATFHSVINWDS
jgi:competence protein ComGF